MEPRLAANRILSRRTIARCGRPRDGRRKAPGGQGCSAVTPRSAPGADQVGVGGPGDGHGLLPGVAGCLRIAVGVVGLASMGEDVGFADTVAEIAPQGAGALVAVGGVAVVP